MIKFTLEDDDGCEEEFELPSKFEVCGRCQGHGTHLNPNIGEHAYTMEEFRESFDEEEAHEYFTRGGMYDVQCEECHGRRVVSVIDYEECERQGLMDIVKRYENWLHEEADYNRLCRMERAMGC